MSEAPFNDAPYPAASTAAIILSGLALPSTPIEFVNRLTEQVLTPGTFETAFSTLLLQAAQLMPVTLYCSINNLFEEFSIDVISFLHEDTLNLFLEDRKSVV